MKCSKSPLLIQDIAPAYYPVPPSRNVDSSSHPKPLKLFTFLVRRWRLDETHKLVLGGRPLGVGTQHKRQTLRSENPATVRTVKRTRHLCSSTKLRQHITRSLLTAHSPSLHSFSGREMRPLNWYWLYDDYVLRNILGSNRRRYDPRPSVCSRAGRHVTFCHVGHCSSALPTAVYY